MADGAVMVIRVNDRGGRFGAAPVVGPRWHLWARCARLYTLDFNLMLVDTRRNGPTEMLEFLLEVGVEEGGYGGGEEEID